MATSLSLDVLTEQLSLADELLKGRAHMETPQDLPGRYGRVVQSIDHVLAAMGCPALLAGSWAVWRHGYLGRVTQDADIVLPADRVDEFLQVAALSGFDILTPTAGGWPKARHRNTGIQVDILPERARPGMKDAPAPTLIRHPEEMGGVVGRLTYLPLPELIELKLAAGRQRDLADVVELIAVNPEQTDGVRQHLAGIHPQYVDAFNRAVEQARRQAEE
jgi:hypothetical protein